jgi:hypothetical protein
MSIAMTPAPGAPAGSVAARPGTGGPAPLYIVCSPSRGVGKTLMARLLNDCYVADGRPVAAFDLTDEGPRLTDFVTDTATVVDIGDMRAQMAFFDGLIAANEVTKVIDVGYRQFENFFTIVHQIGLLEEARRRLIEPLILFMIDPDANAERAYATLRHRFAGIPLLPVRNQIVARGVRRGAAFRHASTLAVSIEIPVLRPSLQSRIDCPGFSFVEAYLQTADPDLPEPRDSELPKWARRIRFQIREIELGLICEQILAALR